MGADIVKRDKKRRGERGETCREYLDINLATPCIERGDDGFSFTGHHRLGDGFERGHADKRQGARQRNATRGGKPDTKAGEGAGTDGDGKGIEIGKPERGLRQHGFDHRHQGFGMAARSRLEGGGTLALAIVDGGGERALRGIEGENDQKPNCSVIRRFCRRRRTQAGGCGRRDRPGRRGRDCRGNLPSPLCRQKIPHRPSSCRSPTSGRNRDRGRAPRR